MRRLGRNNITLEDVAAQAGVSLTTAAAILRDAPGLRASTVTRQRVLETSARLGYRRNAIAASLQKGRTYVIGVLLPVREFETRTHAQRAYPQELLVSVFHAANRAGLRIIPVMMPPRPGHLTVQSVTDRQVDGLILGAIYDNNFLQSVEEAGVPCVEISGTGRYLVLPDNEGGAEAAVEHLAALGHRRIAHWTCGGGVAADARRAGFEAAARRLGVQTFFARSEEEATNVLRQPERERPTALFAFNDYWACVALGIARKLGLCVPDDLSVVGFDNKILAETAYPPLTTINNPLEAIADAAVALLQTRLRGEEPEEPRQVLPAHLVVRGSTAAPSAASGVTTPEA